MGTYIENPKGQRVKLCTAEDIHFRAGQVASFLRNGWEKQEDLKAVLRDPRSLFMIEAYLTPDEKDRLKDRTNYSHRTTRPLVTVNTPPGEKPVGERFDHKPVTVQLQGQRPSVYVYTGLECQQRGLNVYARIAGFRLNEGGTERTVFECDNCAALFSVDEELAEKVRKENPTWAHIVKANPTLTAGT